MDKIHNKHYKTYFQTPSSRYNPWLIENRYNCLRVIAKWLYQDYTPFSVTLIFRAFPCSNFISQSFVFFFKLRNTRKTQKIIHMLIFQVSWNGKQRGKTIPSATPIPSMKGIVNIVQLGEKYYRLHKYWYYSWCLY